MPLKIFIFLCCSLLIQNAHAQKASQTGDSAKADSFSVDSSAYRYSVIGTASYYNDIFNGRRTANGEYFSNSLLTAAHKSLPLGCYAKVTNMDNCRWIIVKINDRMPTWNRREIDLSKAAAKKLDYLSAGLARVKVERLKRKEN